MSGENIKKTSSQPGSADEFLEKLKKALSADGDFPASAKVVAELRMLTSNPKTTANQITEIILREPSLGTRVLSLVNSSFYRRRKPIMTVSQAVVQIGMKPLSELCAGLILLQKFVPAARRSGPFANCLKKTVLTSLLSSSINTKVVSSKTSKTEETGYLAGSFAELGTLLLAYYFPKVYEAAIKRSETKDQILAKSIQEITGLSPLKISEEVVMELNLPDFYRDILETTRSINDGKIISPDEFSEQIVSLGKSLYAAQNISEVMVAEKGEAELQRIIAKVSAEIGIEPTTLPEVLGELPAAFKDHCSAIDISLPALPRYIETFSPSSEALIVTGGASSDPQFMDFLEEIRQAVESGEPTASIITSVMETFAWSLNFDRVVLMLLNGDKTKLTGRMGLGDLGEISPQDIVRPLGRQASPSSPDAIAFNESRPVFRGEPMFKNSWPLAVMPVGFGNKAIGVVYADCNEGGKKEVNASEQAAISVLAELLDRSIPVKS